MQIDERLNLVIPIDRTDGSVAYVHAMPIGRQIFEANFLLLSKAFAAIHSEGLGAISGPRVAALMLQQVGATMVPEGVINPAVPLMAEFRRLANVVVPTPDGYQAVPFDDAVKQRAIDEEDAAEALNGIAFFMLGWHGYPRRTRKANLDAAASLWGAHFSSQTSTDLAASLQTSTEVENTGETNTLQPLGQEARPFSLPS